MNIENIRKRTKLIGITLLFITAFIWGFAMTAQRIGLDYMEPLTFNASRFLMAGTVLLPIRQVLLHISSGKGEKQNGKNFLLIQKQSIKAGCFCGVFLFIGSALQQIGLQYTTVGKAGFISALYIVIIPVLSLLIGKKNSIKIWIAVFIAVIGMYLLCVNEEMIFSFGDLLMLGCAFWYSMHILTIEHFSVRIDALRMASTQFFVAGFLSLILAFFAETPHIKNILPAWKTLLVVGVVSGGIAFTAQIVGQRYVQASIASLIMSLESVFALIGGWLILDEVLNKREILGCILVFSSIILSQIKFKTAEGREKVFGREGEFLPVDEGKY